VCFAQLKRQVCTLHFSLFVFHFSLTRPQA
jgi:hypothetical protein